MAKASVPRSPAVNRAAKAGAALLVGRDPWDELPSTARTIEMAGVKAFAERGFHGTNLANITKGTGLSTAALYVHFSNKEDLLFSISKRGYVATHGIVEAATAIPDPVEAFRVLVYAITRWQAEEHTISRVVLYEGRALTPEHAEELLAIQENGERKIRALISRGIKAGVFSGGDPRGISTGVMSLSIDVARWYGPNAPYTPDGLGRLYCALAAKMVGIVDES